MKYSLVIVSCLLSLSTNTFSMEDAAIVTAAAQSDSATTKVIPKPPHIIEADNLVQALERDYTSAKGIVPVKGLLEAHKSTLQNNQARLNLNDKERADLANWYQAIYAHMSQMSLQEATSHPLHAYKTQIYALALKLFSKKEAAKQFLKCADYYTDEENELDEFTLHGSKQGYQRSHYVKAKQALAMQTNREQEIKDLKKNHEMLGQKTKETDDKITQLTLELERLKVSKVSLLSKQQQIDAECKSLNSVLKKTTTVYDQQMAKLVTLRKLNLNEIQTIEGAIAEAKKNATGLPHNRTAEKEALMMLTTKQTSLKADQAAIKRDIDLLTDEYTTWKKVLWKLSGFITEYPVEDVVVTAGNPAEAVGHEEPKDATSPN